MKKFRPLAPDPYVKTQADSEFAQFGHLNAIVNYINNSYPKFLKIHLTSIQIRTGHSVPIVLVAAQGVGTAIYAWHDTTARCINGAVPAIANKLQIRSVGGNNDQISFGTGFITSSTNNPIKGDDSKGVDQDDNIIENTNLIVTFDADNPAYDGTIDIYLKYEIITL